MRANGWLKIYATDQEGVGWLPQKMGDRQDIGAIFDYGSYRVIEGKIVSYKLIAQEVLAGQELRDWALEHDHPFYEVPEHFLLKLPVYNLEVEDFHTYYVGEYGVWVHNQNCGGLNFAVKGTPSAGATSGLTAEMTANPFVTRAELSAHLKEHNIESGVFLVRAAAKSQAGLMSPEEWAKWLTHEEGVSAKGG